MTNCECPLAGFCQRHQVEKPVGWHKLCQTRESYFAAWEDGRGPGQSGRKPKPTKRRSKKPPMSDEKKEQRRKQAEEANKKKERLIGLVNRFRADSGMGPGDTVERLLATAGGRKIKHLIHILGGNCGCDDRQKWLNEKWPY